MKKISLTINKSGKIIKKTAIESDLFTVGEDTIAQVEEVNTRTGEMLVCFIPKLIK